MQLSTGSYETQVKVFLILVVAFLVTANLVTISFLVRSQSLLEDEARARVLSSTVSLAREAETQHLGRQLAEALPGAAAVVSSRLSRLGGAYGMTAADVVDANGRVTASSQPWREGVVEPLGDTLGGADLASLRAGRGVVISGAEASAPIVSLVPVSAEGAGGPFYLRVTYASAAMETISERIRVLTWAQGIGGSIVLLLVLMFTRFVLKPYRELKAAAAALEPTGEPAGPADDPAFLVASFRGVIEKMRSVEAELERMRRGPSSAGSQESFLAGLSSGVLILDEEARIAALNPAGEKVLGRRAADVAGRDAREVLAASPELVALLDDAVKRGKGHAREMVPYRREGGRVVHLGVTVSSPPGEGGGALCLFSDLTEIRSLQERVLFKENLARVGEISAGIAHEFRNGLATILGYARLEARREDGSAENALAIVREVQSMERMVSEFLRYAAPSRIEKAECDLRDLIEEIAREVKRSGEADVEIAVRGVWPAKIQADEALLRQAFHNLIRNAVEAALEGDEPRRVTVSSQIVEEGVAVEVADTGPGFPAEVLDKAFTPFVTTKVRGTGLGLAMAQKVVIGHDGTLEAGNTPGAGGRVRATLPLA